MFFNGSSNFLAIPKINIICERSILECSSTALNARFEFFGDAEDKIY